MQTTKVTDWGSDTLQACREIVSASTDGADILVHEGEFNGKDDRHMSTISRACVGSNVELVVKGVSDPGVVYPHITFIEET